MDGALNICVLTVSDTRTQDTDSSGDLLCRLLTDDGHTVWARRLVQDERQGIGDILRGWCADPAVQVILTTGGTGVTGRDVTPEAVRDVMDIEIPGFGELFRWLSYQSIGTAAIQSRALAARRGGTLIFALPGSGGAVRQAWTEILRLQLDIHRKPCNFTSLMPRFTE